MRQEFASLAKAWQLWQSESQAESVIAVVLVAAILAPFVLEARRRSSPRVVQLSAGQETNA